MNIRLSTTLAALSSLVAVACSGGAASDPGGGTTLTGGGASDPPATTSPGTPTPAPSSTTPAAPATPVQTETWSDGKTLTTSIDIVADAVVTITPGAKITVAAGVSITVHGTLTGDAKANHASITGPSWGGIVVANGGTLTLTGVDLGGAGIQANAGDKLAKYDYGTMSANGTFVVDTGATLATNHAAVVDGGSSSVKGAFTATFLDYSGSDITLDDAAATVSVADSKITATGGDFFVSYSGALLHVEYSVITGSHCPFHFTALDKYTLDHVATRGNGYGPMLYNEATTPNTVSFSSFEDPNFDQTDRTTEIDIDSTYIKTKTTVGVVKISNEKKTPVTAAAPRGTPGPS